MIQCADLYYGAQIPKYTVNDLLNKTEEIIRIKQICKKEMPRLCNISTNFIVTENLQNMIQKAQQKTKIQNETACTMTLQADNFTPLKIRHKGLTERISFDSDTIRRSSACKSSREQHTACTSNRKRDKHSIHTFSCGFQSQRTWTQSQCRKRNCRTAHSSRKSQQIALKQQQLVNHSYEDDDNRRQALVEKRRKQQALKQQAHETFLKMSYHKRLLKSQFDNAGIIEQKPSSLRRNKQTIQIVNFEVIDDSVLLTNKFTAPLNKTIENIVNLRYEESGRGKVQRKMLQDQRDVHNPKIKKNQQQKRQQIHKHTLTNHTYNNTGNRQLSLIPYVTISPGVSLSQSAINATILRSRPAGETSRQKFLSTIENKTFRSYPPNTTSPTLRLMRTVDYDTGDFNKNSKKAAAISNNETKDSFKRSILWSGKAKSDGHKIILQKQQLLKELTDWQ